LSEWPRGKEGSEGKEEERRRLFNIGTQFVRNLKAQVQPAPGPHPCAVPHLLVERRNTDQIIGGVGNPPVGWWAWGTGALTSREYVWQERPREIVPGLPRKGEGGLHGCFDPRFHGIIRTSNKQLFFSSITNKHRQGKRPINVDL